MQFQSINLNQSQLLKAQSIALVLNNSQNSTFSKKIDSLVEEKIASLIADKYFKKGPNPLYIPISKKSNQALCHLHILAVDKKISSYEFIKKISLFAEKVLASDVSESMICLDDISVHSLTKEQILEQVVLAFNQANYRFDAHKSKKTKSKLKKILIAHSWSDSSSSAQINNLNALCHGINLSKDLANQPSNICTPSYFAKIATKLAQKNHLKIDVLDEKQMKALKMKSLLAVSKGSVEEPKMVFLHYQGANKNKKPLALVGKGVCFDTGGISIKPSNAMDEMKYDMCGAASVIGVMKTISEAKLKVNVIGVMALVENMPSAHATKPGDIVRAYNGKTIEILNTDAEGRLVLADAISYTIEKHQPEKLIDIATLTGAVVMTLGGVYSGVMSNDKALCEEIKNAANESLDLTWQLPLHPGYEEQLRSNFADLPNIGNSRNAGTITAAHFLESFSKKSRWAHLDIAGVAWLSGDKKGATGRPVNLLYHWLKQNQ